MDQLHHGGKAVAVASPIPEGAANHEEQGGAQPFAACCDDVLRNMGHQGDAGSQALTDDLINLVHVLCNEQ